MTELHVWMNGLHVGVWSTLRTGTPVFRYDNSWVNAEEGRALSLSLPFTANLEHRGDVVTHYFDNLLPDSADIRRRLRSRFRVRSVEAFDLLAAIGRDCVGAVQLLPPGDRPEDWNRIDAEPLDERQVERTLASVTSDAPLGLRDDEELRLSIAGAQEKTALLRIGRRDQGPRRHPLRSPLGRRRAWCGTQSTLAATRQRVDRAAAPGGLLPGSRRRAGTQVPERRRPDDAGLPDGTDQQRAPRR